MDPLTIAMLINSAIQIGSSLFKEGGLLNADASAKDGGGGGGLGGGLGGFQGMAGGLGNLQGLLGSIGGGMGGGQKQQMPAMPSFTPAPVPQIGVGATTSGIINGEDEMDSGDSMLMQLLLQKMKQDQVPGAI